MLLWLLVVALSSVWALDPEAIPEHPVTTIPVESNGVVNVFFDPADSININTLPIDSSVTGSTNNSNVNGSVKLSDPNGPANVSDIFYPYGSSNTTSTLGFPRTSEGYNRSTVSANTTPASIPSIYRDYNTTNKPDITSPSNMAVTSVPTNVNISNHNVSISSNGNVSDNFVKYITSNPISGKKSEVEGLTNTSSNFDTTINSDGHDNATDNQAHTSDFYLPADALGNYVPENSSKLSNDSGFTSNSSLQYPSNTSIDHNSTKIFGHKRISADSNPNIFGDNTQSGIPSVNNPADITEENGTIFISNVYSHTNIPSVNNPINISNVYSPVNISDIFSPINISNIYSPINISGIYSPVNIINVYSPVNISNINSPVKISNVFSPINICDVYSPVNITNVHSSINASRVYSLISIDDYSRKANISESFKFVNMSNPSNSGNMSDIDSPHNSSSHYDIDNFIDTLNISDILGVFGLKISDLYGPINITVNSNLTNISDTSGYTNLFDNDNHIYVDSPDMFSTTEAYLYSTTELPDVNHPGITAVNATNITNPYSSTNIFKTNKTTNFTTILGVTDVRVTNSSANISDTNRFTNISGISGTSNDSDIDNLIYIDDLDIVSNTSDKNNPVTNTTVSNNVTEASSFSYYTTAYDPMSITVTEGPINVTESYSPPVNFTDEGNLVNISIGLSQDNITIENSTNILYNIDSDNSTHGWPKCSGGDILKHIFFSYRLSPPEVQIPRVYIVPVPVPVEVPSPVQVYNNPHYIPFDYSSYAFGRSLWDIFPYYYGASQPLGTYSPSWGWNPMSYYYPTLGTAPPMISYMGHFDPLGYQGAQHDSYKYQDNSLYTPHDSMMHPRGDTDGWLSPIRNTEDNAFEPSPYFLVDFSEGLPPSLTDQVPQGPIYYNADYGNKESTAYPSHYNPEGSSMPYGSNHHSFDSMTHRSEYSPQGSMSYSTDYNPQGSKSYQIEYTSEDENLFPGHESQDLKLFSDYVIPHETNSYFEYSAGHDKVMEPVPQSLQDIEEHIWNPTPKENRGEKWQFLELKVPNGNVGWTRYLRTVGSRRSIMHKQKTFEAEPPMISKLHSRPQVINLRGL